MYDRRPSLCFVAWTSQSFPYVPIADHFDPQLSFSEEDAQYFQDWGLNIIRLGTMWPGAEPAHQQFNTTYLSA
jgi:endoglycosylceramidase